MSLKRISAFLIACAVIISTLAVQAPDAAFAAKAKNPAKVKIASVKRSGLKITVKWKKTKNAKKYQVYQKIGSGKWKLKKTLKKLSLTVKGAYGKTYSFKVRGVNGKKKGKYSAVKTLKVPKKSTPAPTPDPEPVDPGIDPAALINIIMEPADVTVKDGEEAVFTVEATGEGLSYQWYKNKTGSNLTGTPVEGATAPELKITAALGDVGTYYYCRISNESEMIKTRAASLDVEREDKAYVISQTESINAYEGDAVLMEVEGFGVGNLTYQWYESKDAGNEGGGAIEGATFPTYEVPRVYIEDDGRYFYCVVTDTVKKAGKVIKETTAVSDPIRVSVSVSPEHIQAVKDIRALIDEKGVQSTDTVSLDGLDFYVIANENGKALLLAKQPSSWYDYILSGNYMWNYDIAGASAMVELNTSYLKANPLIDCISVPTLHYTPSKRNVESEADYYQLTKKIILLTEADVTGTYNGEKTAAMDFTFDASVDHIGKALPKEIASMYVDGEQVPWYVRTPYTDPDPRYPKCSRVVPDADGVHVEAVTLGDGVKSYARPAFWIDIEE